MELTLHFPTCLSQCLCDVLFLTTGHLTAKDISVSRIKRLHGILHSYLPKAARNNVSVSVEDGRNWEQVERDVFDRVSDWKRSQNAVTI